MRLADYIIDYFYSKGVTTLFGYWQGFTFLNDAVARHKNIKCIFNHHEQASAFAAVGYSQAKNDVGVCLVSTGCASTNTITGVLSAWQDNLPVIFISGNNFLNETTHFKKTKIKTYGQQEFDIVNLIKPITKYSVMIKEPNEIKYELEKSFFICNNGKKGPVWIDVPLDIQSSLLTENSRSYKGNNQIKKASKSELIKVIDKIKISKRPLILIGSGIKSSKSEKTLEKLIKNFNIPLVYSSSAPEIYGTFNKLSIGSVGSLGCSRAGNFALQNSDLLLVFGSRLSTTITGPDYDKFAQNAFKIVVDIDPIEHSKNVVNIDQFIESDLKFFLKNLLKFKFSFSNEYWIKKCIHWKHFFNNIEPDIKNKNTSIIDLHYLSDVLSTLLDKGDTLVVDSGFIELILPNNISFKRGVKCIHPISQGSMGFALPAAIGSYFNTSKRTVVVVGDGSIMMNFQELETIKYNKLPMVIIVVNNNLYSVITKRQKELFRKRTIGTNSSNGLSCPDFKQTAKLFGFKYFKIKKSKNLKINLEKALSQKELCIVELYGKENQLYTSIGYQKNENGKLERQPLDNLLPFIDRKIYIREKTLFDEK